jgi:hypothetical protein
MGLLHSRSSIVGSASLPDFSHGVQEKVQSGARTVWMQPLIALEGHGGVSNRLVLSHFTSATPNQFDEPTGTSTRNAETTGLTPLPHQRVKEGRGSNPGLPSLGESSEPTRMGLSGSIPTPAVSPIPFAGFQAGTFRGVPARQRRSRVNGPAGAMRFKCRNYGTDPVASADGRGATMFAFTLQRGRALAGAEMRCGLVIVLRTRQASTGPRPRGRGDAADMLKIHGDAIALQRGRALAGAEIRASP